MLAYGVDNGVSDSIVVGVDEVDFGIKDGVDSFLAFNSCLKPPGIVNASIYSNAYQYSGTMKA